ncbi:metallophosphoesterase [Aestuariibacter sp. A3R04]|uniref:metallophosphoesterase family protein n=1 Tax=Aestuariibacter sp. A3R04 TaxID=2841571 RepID=UPI001C08783D|nr:metallophosphoesterase [Aestuariibacter sp. A3R04]MBU3020576.1 metallophosphoesterase [Aestuariibacter sp. A3R04]
MKYCIWMLCALVLTITGCQKNTDHQRQDAPVESSVDEPVDISIAFLADIHLHDFFVAAENLSSSGLPTFPGTNNPVLIRSMQAQLNSTRLFNENYFVFLAALDDLAQRGIKLVALPGDFSDDGQPANVEALRRILDTYHERHGMRFFAITGNHDPVRPFTRAGGKGDFLHQSGKEVAVYSPDHPRCQSGEAWQCSHAVREWGYADITQTLNAHGFLPQPQDVLYETPFGTNELARRGWDWCDEKGTCIFMPDSSYLVEPVDGVWLLAIDANVYVPKGDYADRQFNGSGNAGYNALLTYKPALIRWITSVVKRAEKQGKRLVAFSHFPMADFYDDTEMELADLFGATAMQLRRMPTKETTAALAQTGLKLHMAGHMHLYDVHGPASSSSQASPGLVNVQVPSLAAYQPGYTVVTLTAEHTARVETVIKKDVPGFDALFPLYAKEWQYRRQAGLSKWDEGILSASNYLRFTDSHLREVVRQRYVGREWPSEMAQYFKAHTVGEVLGDTLCNAPASGFSDHFLARPAIALANDYYRIRNAGQFADIGNREEIYSGLLPVLSACPVPEDKAAAQAYAFLKIVAVSAQRVDKTTWVVPGV